MPRVRRSINEMWKEYKRGVKEPLEKVIRAFHYLEHDNPDNPDSFFCIAGYHGEPFKGNPPNHPKKDDERYKDWWGGYCQHGTILFPTWHRAYLLRFENAMRKAPGCQDVTLPFWDELIDPNETPVPEILTMPMFELDGEKNYQTVRYPLSGLVGDKNAKRETEKYNRTIPDEERTRALDENITGWLTGKILPPDEDEKGGWIPATSVRTRFLTSFDVPHYTPYSNNESMKEWLKKPKVRDNFEPLKIFSIEAGHDAMHLASGGFNNEVRNNNYDPKYQSANGDMGENNTSSFDPMFYLHHCFIDHAFWVWQKRHGFTKKGSLEVIEGFPGTKSPGSVDIPLDVTLDMNTELLPFQKPNGNHFTSDDVTDIGELGYSYGQSSVSKYEDPKVPVVIKNPFEPGHGFVPGAPELDLNVKQYREKTVHRASVSGSFVIRTYLKVGEEKKLIAIEPVLSRWNVDACANCQNHLVATNIYPVYEGYEDAEYPYDIQVKIVPGQRPGDGFLPGPGAPEAGDRPFYPDDPK